MKLFGGVVMNVQSREATMGNAMMYWLQLARHLEKMEALLASDANGEFFCRQINSLFSPTNTPTHTKTNKHTCVHRNTQTPSRWPDGR